VFAFSDQQHQADHGEAQRSTPERDDGLTPEEKTDARQPVRDPPARAACRHPAFKAGPVEDRCCERRRIAARHDDECDEHGHEDP
jgi:hypothetical protein